MARRYHRIAYHLFLLPALPYVYKDLLKPASIDRVLILDRPLRQYSTAQFRHTAPDRSTAGQHGPTR